MIINKIIIALTDTIPTVIQRYWPYWYCKYLYWIYCGKITNFSNPRDLNEKIQWLEFFTDTSEWSRLADKYAVRDYVKEKVGEDLLVPLLGKWDNAADIDFSKLPNQFVIKPNNGSYDCCIVTDKEHTDLEEIRRKMDYSMKHSFGYETAEPHYLRIKPCIIAEQLLETDEPEGLVDYKVWCFDGKPYCFFICGNRDNTVHRVDYNYHDLDWTRYGDNVRDTFRNDFCCPKPENLDKLIEYASKLSEGFPQARIDFYNIHGKIYFGEVTMTASMGMVSPFTQEILDDMGSHCILPKRSFSIKVKTFFNRWLPRL